MKDYVVFDEAQLNTSSIMSGMRKIALSKLVKKIFLCATFMKLISKFSRGSTKVAWEKI